MNIPIPRLTTEIVLCDICQGSGVVWHERLVDHHRGEYERTQAACGECKGSGRLLRTLRDMPYVPQSVS